MGPCTHRFLNPFVDSRDVLLGHRAAHDLVDELEVAVGVRLELDPHVTELAAAAGLFLVPSLGLGGGW